MEVYFLNLDLVLQPLSSSIIRTALLWVTFFTSAASESIRPPTLLDIRDRLDCSTEEATYQFSVQAAGGLAGCLVSGFLADRSS